MNPLPSPSEWDIPDDLMIVKPPIMERRQPGRPRNTCRIPSQGEHPIRQECSTCGQFGHTRNDCTGRGSGSGSGGSKKSTKKGIMTDELASESGSQNKSV